MNNRITKQLPDADTASCADWIYCDGKWWSLVRPVCLELGHLCTYDCDCPLNEECEPDLPVIDFDAMLRDGLRKSDSLGPVDDEGCGR